MSKKKKDWRTEKERLLKMGLDERRKEYRGNFTSLDKIPTWRKNEKTAGKGDDEEKKGQPFCPSEKVSLHKGDITILEVDAIVNAANSSLLGGGGVDGCIHRAAGPCLYEECHTLNGCVTGKAKITGGYDLPAKYVIHTVGPIARGLVGSSQREDLEACYKNSLQLVKDNGLRSVAFPCISTGIYGFPNEPAAEIALRTVKSWVRRNRDEVDRVIFCVFLETDYKIYKEKMAEFFSQDNDVDDDSDTQGEEDDGERDEEGPADAEMLSQKEEEEDEEEEEQGETGEESGDVDMASQILDEDETVVKGPAEDVKKDKEKDKEKEKEAATDDSTVKAEEGKGTVERKTQEQEEEKKEEEKKETEGEKKGGAGEPAAAAERDASSGQKSPGKKSPAKLNRDFLGGSGSKLRAPLAEEEEVMDVEDGDQGEPDGDTSTEDDTAELKKDTGKE